MGADQTPQRRPVRFAGSAPTSQGYASPMTRSTRGRLARVFVVLAIVSLASIAVAPRGMLRAVVIDDLDLMAHAEEAPAIDAPADAVQLPGVRAMVSREEQDPGEAVLDALTTIVLPGAPLPASEPWSDAVDATVLLGAPLAPSSLNGDRAPPRSI